MTLLAICFAVCSFAQKNKAFPELSGVTVDGQTVTLPASTKGKYTLVGIAFSKKAEEDLTSWMNPMLNTFRPGNKKANVLIPEYDVNMYFVPMFTGLNKAAAATAMKKTKESLDKRLHQHVVFYKGDMDNYKDPLQLKDKEIPYFFVLDPDGNIVLTLKGKYTDEKMESIEEILE
ncbi:hypothetical protein MYP_3835 [Sporocytophaga myxococcoides]|uniref:Thioredoxin domain-containing protein n=1 Tax=Sporocytophaga myxococcoides TaxID=153721 RepID=A0A098LI18_9BACT|nr:hypothetical protein MYP_3835 [Sporocytophaga myxococcoides]